MDIYKALPLLDGWKWEPRDYDLSAAPAVIEPGKSFDLTPVIHARGWFKGASTWTDNPYIQLIATYDDAKVDISPFALHVTGQYQPLNIGLSLTRYDDTVFPNVFAMLLTPSEPLPFSREFRAYVHNPPARPDKIPNTVARLYGYTVTTIEIVDTDVFIRSFQRLYPH